MAIDDAQKWKHGVSLLHKLIFRIAIGDNCWEWLGGKDGDGYGWIYHKRKNISAHRVAYRIFVGPLPDDKLVCHTCDNPNCVRPFHLFVGSNGDNAADMAQKGRSAFTGIRNPKNKLTEIEVLNIWDEYYKQKKCYGSKRLLATKYNTTPMQISNIVFARHWRHLLKKHGRI